MSGASTFLEYLGIDAYSIVAKPKAKHVIIVSDLDFDSVRVCMIESVSKDFERDPAYLVLGSRRQSSPLALLNYVENWRIFIRSSRSRQFFTRGPEQFGQISFCNWLRSQPLNRIPALGKRRLGLIDRIGQRSPCFIGPCGHRFANY
jgi:hypothetical protein